MALTAIASPMRQLGGYAGMELPPSLRMGLSIVPRVFKSARIIAVAASLFAQDPLQPRPVFGITVVIPSALQGRIYHLRRNTPKLPDFRKMKPAGKVYTTSLNIPTQNFRRGFPGVTKRFEWFAIVIPTS
jgi:hypothetical protein